MYATPSISRAKESNRVRGRDSVAGVVRLHVEGAQHVLNAAADALGKADGGYGSDRAHVVAVLELAAQLGHGQGPAGRRGGRGDCCCCWWPGGSADDVGRSGIVVLRAIDGGLAWRRGEEREVGAITMR